MKKFKTLCLVLTVLMCCCFFTGCMMEDATIAINENGSGTLNWQWGFTKEGYIAVLKDGWDDIERDNTPFMYNGIQYYGQGQEYETFSNLDELNSILASGMTKNIISVFEKQGITFDVGVANVTKNSNGEFVLTLQTTDKTGDLSEVKSRLLSEYSAEKVDSIFKAFVAVRTIEFPNKVVQTKGPSGVIAVDGNKVTIDYMKIAASKKGNQVYEFVVNGGNSNLNNNIPNNNSNLNVNTNTTQNVSFTDVENKSWYYNAVLAMAEGKLVNGMGNGAFEPNGTLTYAQFCQILANAAELESGSGNGYWAYKAINSCINAGYISSKGTINSANYDVAIPREIAVSAMYIARKNKLSNKIGNYSSNNIPDYYSIASEYRANIINAYNYGITTGVDAQGTFMPKKSLTRAEICQLFYNLNWTKPEKVDYGVLDTDIFDNDVEELPGLKKPQHDWGVLDTDIF